MSAGAASPHAPVSDLDAQERYWRARLAGALPVLDIGSDRPRPPVQTFNHSTETVDLGLPPLEALRRLAASERVSPLVVMLAALDVVLLRLTGGDEVIVGSLAADAGAGDEGRAVDVVALRADAAGDPDVRSFLARVAESVAGAGANRGLPFDRVVEIVGGDRDAGRGPVFQVMLVPLDGFSGVSDAPVEREDLREVAEHVARCDLVVLASATDGGLTLSCHYDAMLFDAARVRRLSRPWAGSSPRPSPTDPSPLSRSGPTPSATVWLAAVNDTRRPYPRDACLHELFERHVARRPDAVALAWTGARHLRRAEPAGQRPRASPAAARRPRGDARGRLRRAVAGDGGVGARHPQGGRRLRAAGPEPSPRARRGAGGRRRRVRCS